MALVLRGGESLEIGDARFDETGRFQLMLTSGGDLVIDAYTWTDRLTRRTTGATNTHFGDDLHLHLTEDGQLQLRRKSDPSKVMWRMPYSTPMDVPSHDPPRVRWHPAGWPPVAGSTLHLQADGVLVLYGPDMTSDQARWAMGTGLAELSPEGDPEADIFVAPGALILQVEAGTLSPSGSSVIRNDTHHTLEIVTKLQRPHQIANGAYATISPTGVDDPVGTLYLPFIPSDRGSDGTIAIRRNPVRLTAGSVISVGQRSDGEVSLQ